MRVLFFHRESGTRLLLLLSIRSRLLALGVRLVSGLMLLPVHLGPFPTVVPVLEAVDRLLLLYFVREFVPLVGDTNRKEVFSTVQFDALLEQDVLSFIFFAVDH